MRLKKIRNNSLKTCSPVANHYLKKVWEKNRMIGGVSHVFNRYSKGNNKHLKYYDSKQQSKHVNQDS